jgi:hypothetical protein
MAKKRPTKKKQPDHKQLARKVLDAIVQIDPLPTILVLLALDHSQGLASTFTGRRTLR